MSSRRLPQVKNGSITNGLIVEVIRLRTVKQLQWRAVIDKIIQLYGSNWPSNEPSELTLIKTLSTLYKKYRSLVVKKNLKSIEQFENSHFHIPVPQLCGSTNSTESVKPTKRKSLLRKEHNEAFNLAITNLCCELRKATDETSSLRHQFVSLQKKTSVRNIHRREKRKLGESNSVASFMTALWQ